MEICIKTPGPNIDSIFIHVILLQILRVLKNAYTGGLIVPFL